MKASWSWSWPGVEQWPSLIGPAALPNLALLPSLPCKSKSNKIYSLLPSCAHLCRRLLQPLQLLGLLDQPLLPQADRQIGRYAPGRQIGIRQAVMAPGRHKAAVAAGGRLRRALQAAACLLSWGEGAPRSTHQPPAWQITLLANQGARCSATTPAAVYSRTCFASSVS